MVSVFKQNTGWTSYFYPERVRFGRKNSWKSSHFNIHWGLTLTMAKIRSDYWIPVYKSWWWKKLRNAMVAKDFMFPIPRTINRIVASRTHHLKLTIQNYWCWLRRSVIMLKKNGTKKLRCIYYYLHAILLDLYILHSYRINVHRNLSWF